MLCSSPQLFTQVTFAYSTTSFMGLLKPAHESIHHSICNSRNEGPEIVVWGVVIAVSLKKQFSGNDYVDSVHSTKY